MAVLQAARAQTLGLPHDSALSWGLNRAIFYAAAKRGFQGTPPPPADGESHGPAAPPPEKYRLGNDEAYRDASSKTLIFKIGEDAQTVADFERQVIARFGTPENFGAAWKEATALVEGFDRPTLESGPRFYAEVYKPRRDELSDKWTQTYSPPPKSKRRPSG
jgi:hypothetical protein